MPWVSFEMCAPRISQKLLCKRLYLGLTVVIVMELAQAIFGEF